MSYGPIEPSADGNDVIAERANQINGLAYAMWIFRKGKFGS
jgi:hypothetical protein